MADASPTLRPALTGLSAVVFTPANEAPPPVAALTRGLARGEEAAFREFHARYFDRLYHFLLVVTRGDEHAAQEAVQETLLRVARRAREFDDEEVFWGWLKAVARNAARDRGRKQRRYLAALERFAFWRAQPVAAPPHEEARLSTLLEESLAEMEPPDRRLIEGKYLRGDSVLELAAENGLTEKAVESRLARLRRRLADSLLQKLRMP